MNQIRYLLLVLLVLLLDGCTMNLQLSGDVTAQAEETQGVVVNDIPTLTVNHFAGKIDVQEGESGKITADLTKKSRLADETAAQAQLDEIEMAFSQSGSDVTLSIEGPESTEEVLSGASGDLELTVPPGTVLVLNLGAGEITVTQPTGDVTVNSGAGQATVTLPQDASFRLVVAGGVTGISSDFEGVPSGGIATDVDTIIGSNPTQTLTFNVGAGEVNLRKAQ
jgi:hypothetical protein